MILNCQHRAVATRYEKLATRYLAVIQIAAINEWLRPDTYFETPPSSLRW